MWSGYELCGRASTCVVGATAPAGPAPRVLIGDEPQEQG